MHLNTYISHARSLLLPPNIQCIHFMSITKYICAHAADDRDKSGENIKSTVAERVQCTIVAVHTLNKRKMCGVFA